jgi:hypothetical protein
VEAIVAASAVLLVGYCAYSELQSVRGWGDTSERTAVALIQAHSARGSSILAPPYYLFLSDRRAIGEYADINIWALRAAAGDRRSIDLIAATVRSIKTRSIPIAVVDNRVRRLSGVMEALQSTYSRLSFNDPLPADRSVELWVPK